MFTRQETADYVIAGLGNPGSEYADTRHNAGFKTVEALAKEFGVNYWKRQGEALVGKATWHDKLIVLVKPQSYMNLSGGPVKGALKSFNAAPDNLIVIHDELDIPSGTVRVKFGGGHAGHNGLRSICDSLGTRNWLASVVRLDVWTRQISCFRCRATRRSRSSSMPSTSPRRQRYR